MFLSQFLKNALPYQRLVSGNQIFDKISLLNQEWLINNFEGIYSQRDINKLT